MGPMPSSLCCIPLCRIVVAFQGTTFCGVGKHSLGILAGSAFLIFLGDEATCHLTSDSQMCFMILFVDIPALFSCL
jgi:hypothetical protein